MLTFDRSKSYQFTASDCVFTKSFCDIPIEYAKYQLKFLASDDAIRKHSEESINRSVEFYKNQIAIWEKMKGECPDTI
jgi:hypothetical protein